MPDESRFFCEYIVKVDVREGIYQSHKISLNVLLLDS